MDAASVKAFAKAVGTSVESISSQGWANCKCPLAPWTHDSGRDSSPSFAIKITPNGASHFQCYTCENGDLYHLVRLLKGYGASQPRYNLKDAMDLVNAEEDSDLVLNVKEFDAKSLDVEDDGNNDAIYSENWLHSFVKAQTSKNAMDYLQSRGLSAATIDDLDIRYDTKRNAVCFPIRDAIGNLCGLRGRYITPDPEGPPYHIYKNEHKHYNRMVWYGEHWVEYEKPVLLVESVFDLAAVYPIYPNVLAPLTVGMGKHKVRRISAAYDIVTLFDVGKGGDKARDLIDKYLPDSVRTHLMPEGQHRYKLSTPAEDPGEMQPLQLVALLAPHLPIPTP